MNRTSGQRRGPAPSPAPARSALTEDRYRRGARRTAGEPLAASWEPDGAKPRERERSIKNLIGNYGWRIYAVPVLVVLTALVVLDTAAQDDQGGGVAQQGGGLGQDRSEQAEDHPKVDETPPANTALVDIPTAVLPDGPSYTEQGAGTWEVVQGRTEKVGDGPLRKYAIEIEVGINPIDHGGDVTTFARTVDAYLADQRSWVGTGNVSMQRVDDGSEDFRISLTSVQTTHGLCGNQIQYESSCYNPDREKVVINVSRWVRGAKAFSNDIANYRQYAINHEVGHALGKGHEACKDDGRPAPVMMQQTFGVANDYVAKLNEVDASNRGAVPADGKTCTPNAFPVAPR